MSARRWTAASIVLNETILWITGGWDVNGLPLLSSEYIKLSGSSPGPDLPMYLQKHAMIAINKTHSMIIGGFGSFGVLEASDDLDLTFYFNHGNQQWVDGPRLIQARKFHAVGIVNDQVTMTNLVIVTGGQAKEGYYDNAIHLSNKLHTFNSTEILVDSQWLPGKKRHTLKWLTRIGFKIKAQSN